MVGRKETNMYGVRTFFWTGDMNTYRYGVMDNLTKREAEMLYNAIEADGNITEVSLLKDGETIMLKDCYGCEGTVKE